MPTNPPTTTPAAKEAWINRVDALLAKAASTEFGEEADALMAKAQQLMARHAIDDAMLAASGRSPRSEPICEDFVVHPPYATAKAALLATVAGANHCRAVAGSAGSGRQRCTLVGHEADLANVRALYGSLSVHAAAAMIAAEVPGYDTPRRFRHAFLLAFTARIGERLRAAAVSAERDAQAAQAAAPGAGQGVDVVLADRRSEVDQAFRRSFPNVRRTTSRASSSAGIMSGRAAADGAGLGQRPLAAERPHLRLV